MQEKPKLSESKTDETRERADGRAGDQAAGRYYYDDAHGYEVYKNEDDEVEEKDESV